MKHVRGTHAKRMGLHDKMDMIYICFWENEPIR